MDLVNTRSPTNYMCNQIVDPHQTEKEIVDKEWLNMAKTFFR